MAEYRYEMHIHTSPCSAGGSDIRDHIRVLKERGFSGMVVTNHFYYGDTRIDRDLPWEEFVDAYRQDYLYGLEYAKEVDFDLLFGLEEHTGNGQEVLLYGITPELIAAHPELKMASAEKYAEVVHSAGGLIYQAHPYRARSYVISPYPLDCLDMLDGIEVYNAGNDEEWNESAKRLAEEKGLRCTAGSDGHHTDTAGRAGIVTSERIRTNEDLVRILSGGEYAIFVNTEYTFPN
ncbi:MAG: PHP domain-containing protein [Clostridia bacterium]|nr:PHP domain-containing protein [Clostridia bacterium]